MVVLILYPARMGEPPAQTSATFVNSRLTGPILLVCGAAMMAMGAAQDFRILLVLGAALAGIAAGRMLWRRDLLQPDRISNAGGAASTVADSDLRALIEILVTPAIVIDSGGRVIAHNALARELFASLDYGQPLYHVSRHPGLLDAAQRARTQGIAQTGQIADATDGGRRLLVNVSPMERHPASNDRGTLLIQFRDFSEQERLAQSRADFIANASHELRTPLASLKGFIETLQGPASGDSAARKRFLDIMETQAARMARIIDDLLSLSRIEMQAHIVPQTEVDLVSIVTATVAGLEPIAREAKMTLHLKPIDRPFLTRGDADELEQVVQNLIENALKYGKAGGNVEVSISEGAQAARYAGRIVIDVSDDGPGIAEEHLPRLTERFYRVDTAASRERGGTGLGLAIVKHILNRHRGELLIRSTLGQGSRFTVVLPPLKDARPHR